MKSFYQVTILIILSVFLFVFVWPKPIDKIFNYFNIEMSVPEKPFILGLDLLGGTHLLYEADLSQIPNDERTDAMDGVRDVIERRVNFFGVSEPVVQISGDNRLIIELAGISDVGQAIELIGETPFLEFKEEVSNIQELLSEFEERQLAGEATVEDELMLHEQLYQSTGLSGKHLKKAQLVFDSQTGQPQISLELNEEGAELFSEVTKRNVGKTVAIFLDGLAISNPVVQDEITSGQAIISGRFTPEEARLLAIRLNSGALPVPIHLISQQTIGASLGAESLAKSLKAGMYGLVFVSLFMIVFYRLPGLIAVVALAIYVLIVLSIYKMLPVTLTLAGIAGFILSLGMAVDANVLIFARLKEELALGRSLPMALKEGFSRAWLSIRDSHVTALASAGVLYVFTTSIVKGFALTLGIGVLLSLFTAIIVTKAFLTLCAGRWFESKRWLFR